MEPPSVFLRTALLTAGNPAQPCRQHSYNVLLFFWSHWMLVVLHKLPLLGGLALAAVLFYWTCETLGLARVDPRGGLVTWVSFGWVTARNRPWV